MATKYIRLMSGQTETRSMRWWWASVSVTDEAWGSTARWGTLAHVNGYASQEEAEQAALDKVFRVEGLTES